MLQLREYEPQRVALFPAEVAELAQMTRGSRTSGVTARVIQQLVPSAQPGHFDIQPGPYVGRFALRSGRVVDIASRFAFADLLDVLRVASRQPTLLHDAPTPSDNAHGLIDLIAMAFARETERIVGFGLVKGYRSRTFTRPPYPGVLDGSAHLTRFQGRPDRLITRANRLTVDVPVNQVLAAAHRLLRLQAYRDPQIAIRLRGLDPVFSRVDAIRNPLRTAAGVQRDVPARYREAFALALISLAGRTALPAGCGSTGVSVLFNMTKVWESYVQDWLERQLPAGHRISKQHPILLTDDGSRIQASADFVILDHHGDPVAVYDAKYKPWADKPNVDDLYQMTAYAYRLGLDRATLLYPGRGERSEVVIGRYRIATIGLDVLRPVYGDDRNAVVP